MKRRQTAGTVLLSVCIVSAFLLFITLAALGSIQAAQERCGGAIHAAAAKRSAASNALISLADSLSAISASRRVCALGSSRVGRHDIMRQVCAEASTYPENSAPPPLMIAAQQADAAAFPLFDFNSLFAQQSPCALTSTDNALHTPAGFRLSSASLAAHTICRNPILNERVQITTNSNLVFDTDVTLAQPGAARPWLLAAAGYLESSAVLTTHSHLLLVAGGDLHIRQLNVLSETAAQITALSASGIVAIDQINGSATLRVIAARGAAVPADAISAENQLIPNRLRHYTIGFTG